MTREINRSASRDISLSVPEEDIPATFHGPEQARTEEMPAPAFGISPLGLPPVARFTATFGEWPSIQRSPHADFLPSPEIVFDITNVTPALAEIARAADIRHSLVKKTKVSPFSHLDEMFAVELFGEDDRLLCKVILWSHCRQGRKELHISGIHLEPWQSKGKGIGTAVMAAIYRTAQICGYDDITLSAEEDGRRAWTREEFGLKFRFGMTRAIQQTFDEWRDTWRGRAFFASDEGRKYLELLQAKGVYPEEIGDRPYLYPPSYFLFSWIALDLRRDLRKGPITEKEIWRLEVLSALKARRSDEVPQLFTSSELFARLTPQVVSETPLEKIRAALAARRDEIRPLLSPLITVDEAEEIFLEILTRPLLFASIDVDVRQGLRKGISEIANPTELLRHLELAHYGVFAENDSSFSPLDLFYLVLAGVPLSELLERMDRHFRKEIDVQFSSPMMRRPSAREFLRHRAATATYYDRIFRSRELPFRDYLEVVSTLPDLSDAALEVDLDWAYSARYVLPLYDGPLNRLVPEALTELIRRKNHLFFILTKVRAGLAGNAKKREMLSGLTPPLKQVLALDGVDVDAQLAAEEELVPEDRALSRSWRVRPSIPFSAMRRLTYRSVSKTGVFMRMQGK